MPESQQAPTLTISTEIAHLYKRHYGRGPTKITAHLVHDVVICLTEGIDIPAQTALLDRGKIDLAQALYGELQRGMADEMCKIVERQTGRSVRTYVPGYNAEAGATTDVFHLERDVAQ